MHCKCNNNQKRSRLYRREIPTSYLLCQKCVRTDWLQNAPNVDRSLAEQACLRIYLESQVKQSDLRPEDTALFEEFKRMRLRPFVFIPMWHLK